MVKETIGNCPVDITKEGSEVKIVFHPVANLIQRKKLIRTTIGIMLGASAILKKCNIEVPEELRMYEK